MLDALLFCDNAIEQAGLSESPPHRRRSYRRYFRHCFRHWPLHKQPGSQPYSERYQKENTRVINIPRPAIMLEPDAETSMNSFSPCLRRITVSPDGEPMPRVCIVLAPGAEEIEFITVGDILVRAGCEVIVATAETQVVEGSRGLPLAAHTSLNDVLAGRRLTASTCLAALAQPNTAVTTNAFRGLSAGSSPPIDCWRSFVPVRSR